MDCSICCKVAQLRPGSARLSAYYVKVHELPWQWLFGSFWFLTFACSSRNPLQPSLFIIRLTGKCPFLCSSFALRSSYVILSTSHVKRFLRKESCFRDRSLLCKLRGRHTIYLHNIAYACIGSSRAVRVSTTYIICQVFSATAYTSTYAREITLDLTSHIMLKYVR